MQTAVDTILEQAECHALWQLLIEGNYQIVDSFNTCERAYLAIAPSPIRRTPLSARALEILQAVLLGNSSKAIAIELGLANSTVAVQLKQSLAALGHRGFAAKVPLGLAMLLHAAHGRLPVPLDCGVGLSAQQIPCQILSATLPSLATILPPAVRDVVHMSAEGRSHAEIAAKRCTSRRTVANQLATAFQRLGVSGRSGLLGYLTLAKRSSDSRAVASIG